MSTKIDELNRQLELLNQAVVEAVERRTKWMDEHMSDYAHIKIGEEIYNSDGNKLGIVTEYYRYWGNRDWRFDTSMHINYCYKRAEGWIDNTSRQYDIFMNKKDALAQAKLKLELMQKNSSHN